MGVPNCVERSSSPVSSERSQTDQEELNEPESISMMDESLSCSLRIDRSFPLCLSPWSKNTNDDWRKAKLEEYGLPKRRGGGQGLKNH